MEYKRHGGNEDLYQDRSNWKDGESPLKVIMEGTYRGRHFVIGAHRSGNPNAYLEVLPEDSMYADPASIKEDDYYDGNLSHVNCGSTYYGKAYWDENDPRVYVGWDYGHAYDYNVNYAAQDGTVWSLIDILMEVASAENEIQMQNENDGEYWNRICKN